MRYFLCGQTGNINRGCEAIVKSTVELLGQRRGDINLVTFNAQSDAPVARELGINLLPYGSYPTPVHRYFCAAIRKIHKRSLAGRGLVSRPLFRELARGDMCLNIGGDIYCYNRPTVSYVLNRYTSKHGIDNVMWCCSIEKHKIDAEMLADLKRYKYIFVREALSYQNLLDVGIDPAKVIKCCDPAFFLKSKKVPLPEGFIEGNTVGINVSEMVVDEKHPQVYQSVKRLITYILENTDMAVCLIPHVYSIKANSNDYPILQKLYQEFAGQRISIVDQEYNCEQLKHIISKCRFFIGARTHATIAAYSSGVPTIVLGYSVKSKGIATDLFGTYRDFVLQYDEIQVDESLLQAFRKLVARELEVKARYAAYLPTYKQSLLDAIKKYIRPAEETAVPSEICDRRLCSGCGACANRCPVNAIKMETDENGFLYPRIDPTACIACGKCRKICPAANPPRDENIEPMAYAATNVNEEIRKASSSGGVFTALAEYIINRGGVVFGVGYDEKLNAIHKKCETLADLAELRGSKYTQSHIGTAFEEAKSALDNGRLVLFTGTPCQIGGLMAYLGKEYENLYTQDLICHGVPSPQVFSKYLKYREECAGAKAEKVSFRSKAHGWKVFSMRVDFANGGVYEEKLTNDLYLKAFLQNATLRTSCSHCKFKQVHRQSDLTLADFWGADQIVPDLNDDKGLSLVLVHSQKGKQLLLSAKESLNVVAVDFRKAIKENSSLTNSVKPAVIRDAFFNDMSRLRFDKVIDKYCGSGAVAKARRIWRKIW